MSIAIMTDTNSGITMEEGKRIGIYVLPMPIFIDNICYLEGMNIEPEQMYEAMELGYQTSTSQPSPSDIEELWNTILKSGCDEIVHIPMTSGLSGSCQNAALLSEEYKGKVYVVDNHRISVTQREAVIECGKRKLDGQMIARIIGNGMTLYDSIDLSETKEVGMYGMDGGNRQGDTVCRGAYH